MLNLGEPKKQAFERIIRDRNEDDKIFIHISDLVFEAVKQHAKETSELLQEIERLINERNMHAITVNRLFDRIETLQQVLKKTKNAITMWWHAKTQQGRHVRKNIIAEISKALGEKDCK